MRVVNPCGSHWPTVDAHQAQLGLDLAAALRPLNGPEAVLRGDWEHVQASLDETLVCYLPIYHNYPSGGVTPTMRAMPGHDRRDLTHLRPRSHVTAEQAYSRWRKP